MTQIIRISDVSTINKTHYGFVFTEKSNIKKYFKDNNIKYYDFYSDNKLDIDMFQIKNNKINILEQYDEQGLYKETIIYYDNFDEIINNLKEEMKIIPCSNGKGYINIVEVFITKEKLLDESIIYHIKYTKIIDNDTNEDITHMFYDSYTFITNIPIIYY
jgi:hypothetical protein